MQDTIHQSRQMPAGRMGHYDIYPHSAEDVNHANDLWLKYKVMMYSIYAWPQ